MYCQVRFIGPRHLPDYRGTAVSGRTSNRAVQTIDRRPWRIYRLVDDFFIGFEDELSARQCLEALRHTLWEYNLHLNETKTKILQSRRIFDTGWKYEINNFQIPDESPPKQYEGVERLLDITDHPLAPIHDWGVGAVPLGHLGSVSGSTWWLQARHHTMSPSLAFAALPSVIGGPGADFIAQ